MTACFKRPRTSFLNSHHVHVWCIVVLFSHQVVSDFVTPWTAARPASLSFTISQSLLKLSQYCHPWCSITVCYYLLLFMSIWSHKYLVTITNIWSQKYLVYLISQICWHQGSLLIYICINDEDSVWSNTELFCSWGLGIAFLHLVNRDRPTLIGLNSILWFSDRNDQNEVQA